MAEYGLIVKFTDDSQSFTNGFEAGMIWEKLQSGIEKFEMNVRLENVEVVREMCNKVGYIHVFQSYDEYPEYTWFTAMKKITSNN